MCHIKAPQDFTPSFTKWKVLTELCSGVLMEYHIDTVLRGHRSWILQATGSLMEERRVTKPSSMAAAINNLAKVCQSSIVSLKIVGGDDCSWLAAFAESLLSLEIEIQNASGSLVYRTSHLSGQLPRVYFQLQNPSDNSPPDVRVARQLYSIPPDQPLVYTESVLDKKQIVAWCFSWPPILRDSFGPTFDGLIRGSRSKQFATILSVHPVGGSLTQLVTV